ncbi:glycosyltransferase family 4 protein [Erwinia aphidicola]|uniref:glycosyltransferase family 4 protein n=1 Tax=Erwinia aphidicola TaxID=68334 RepID=UPI003019D93C
MKKVVISANTSWYIYNFRKNTILQLIEHGFDVFIVAPEDEYSEKIANLGASFHNIKMQRDGTNPITDFLTFLSFYSIYRKLSPSIVLNFTPKNNVYSTLAASMLKIRVINNIAGLGTLFVKETVVSKVARFLYKLSQKHADLVFFQNEEDRCLFVEKKYIKYKKTERIFGSGVDINRFIPIEAKDDGVVRFLLIGRMLYEKGITFFVDAARDLKSKYGNSVEFYLLGFMDTQDSKSISPEAMNSWVSEGVINYLGVSDEVEKEIAKADCVVLPSFYREGVPKSLLEAGAMGKPIITTDNVGCRETVLDGQNGYLCKIKSSSDLKLCMEKMISKSHQERLAMGMASRQLMISNFDEKLGIIKYLNAIECLLKHE